MNESNIGNPSFGPTGLAALGGMLDDGLLLAEPAGQIISVNNAAIRFLGEGLVGRRLEELFDDPAVAGVMRGDEAACNFVFAPVGSVEMEFSIRIARLADNHVMALILDMTLQRNLEKVRRDFVANVSHELRSPLTSLAGFIETILANDVRDWPTQERFLKIMEEEAARMSRLIDDLLSLSRVEVDEHIIPDEIVALAEVVGAVIASLEGRANSRNMRIILDDQRQPDGPRLLMNGFSDEINEVFHNLIENAIKYGFEGHDITVTIAPPANGQVAISVVNVGEEIGSQHIHRLTERFYRIDKARSRQIGGTGLGLAIVKHIVNRHRGKLDIESSKAGVTKFTVQLPISQPDDAPLAQAGMASHKTVT